MSKEKTTILKELLDGSVQNGHSPLPVNEITGTWVLGLGALTISGLDLSKKKAVMIDELTLEKKLLSYGDFLISRSNTREKVGMASLFKGGLDACIYPDLMMRFRVNTDKINIGYLDHFLRSPSVQCYFSKKAAGTSGSMVKITKATVEKLPVFLPALEEQKAIADILSTWDEAIEKTERLIELKEEHFESLRSTFIGKEGVERQKVMLGNVVQISKKKKLESLQNKKLLTVKLHCLGIEVNNRIKPKLSKSGRPYYLRKEGEILIGRQNFHNGGIGIVSKEIDGGICSNAITSLVAYPQKINPKFLFWSLSRPNFYKKIGHQMDGTGQKEISEKQLLNLLITIPPLNKQIEIATALDLARDEILMNLKVLNSLSLQKQGLMQKLLTGKWRVKIKEENYNEQL